MAQDVFYVFCEKHGILFKKEILNRGHKYGWTSQRKP